MRESLRELKTYLHSHFATGESRTMHRRKHRMRLGCEVLEPREVPAVFYWVYNDVNTGAFETAANWRQKDGAGQLTVIPANPPGAQDDVILDANIATGAVQALNAVTIKSMFNNGLTFYYNSTLTIEGGTSAMSGGKVQTSATGTSVTISGGKFTMSGGSFSGTSSREFNITGGNEFIVTGNASEIAYRVDIEGANVTVTNQSVSLATGRVNVTSGKLEFATGAKGLVNFTGGATTDSEIRNEGTVRVALADNKAAVTVDKHFTNTSSGVFEVVTGKITLPRAGDSGYDFDQTQSAVTRIHSGAILDVAAHGSNFNGGRLETVGAEIAYIQGGVLFHSGDLDVGRTVNGFSGFGALSISGNLTIDGGVVHLDADADVWTRTSDHIHSGLTLTLGGTSSLISFISNLPAQPDKSIYFAVMSAGSGIVGNFANITIFEYTQGGGVAPYDYEGWVDSKEKKYTLRLPP